MTSTTSTTSSAPSTPLQRYTEYQAAFAARQAAAAAATTEEDYAEVARLDDKAAALASELGQFDEETITAFVDGLAERFHYDINARNEAAATLGAWHEVDHGFGAVPTETCDAILTFPEAEVRIWTGAEWTTTPCTCTTTQIDADRRTFAQQTSPTEHVAPDEGDVHLVTTPSTLYWTGKAWAPVPNVDERQFTSIVMDGAIALVDADPYSRDGATVELGTRSLRGPWRAVLFTGAVAHEARQLIPAIEREAAPLPGAIAIVRGTALPVSDGDGTWRMPHAEGDPNPDDTLYVVDTADLDPADFEVEWARITTIALLLNAALKW